ncbi:hypothetical protein EX30DRAFT_365878 [Ascodesmis nigricans]|uniref:SAP domain-containing protein n=1 Tax=Ascodesmis nigricans TaxID=341454 RepID=A0A4S2MN65_9PEZI|nr:hypothetical protein EX30DRAFT_365878 [Ascodesmis nigricans]
MSFYLSKKRKPELIDLSHKLGLPTESLLKSDLEANLIAYLDAHEAELGGDETWEGYYDARGSPKKRGRAAAAVSGRKLNGVNGTGEMTMSPSPLYDGDRGVSGEVTSSPPPPPGQEMKMRLRQSPRLLRTPRTAQLLTESKANLAGFLSPGPSSPAPAAHNEQLRELPMLPPTPAAVARGIEAIEAPRFVKEPLEAYAAAAKEAVCAVRERVSNSVSINLVAVAVEAAIIVSSLIPRTVVVAVPGILASNASPGQGAMGEEAPQRNLELLLPDLFTLLTWAFWAPVVVWAVTSFLLPAVIGGVVNFAHTPSPSPFASESHGHPFSSSDDGDGDGDSNAETQLETRRDGKMWKIDPLTFAVAKALVVWAVYWKGVVAGEVVEWVGERVAEGMLVGAGVGGVVAVWEGIVGR